MPMHLFSYDIESDALRVKIAKLLIQAGLYRIQYSVFMGSISAPALARLKKKLSQLERGERWAAHDSVMILPLHQYSEDYIEFLGAFPDRWPEITGKIHTLIL